MRVRSLLVMVVAVAGLGAASAQLVPRLPSLPTASLPGMDAVGDGVSRATGSVGDALTRAQRAAFARLVRDHPDSIALDPQGFPARAGELVVDAPDEALLAAAAARGYALIAREDVLGIGFARLRVPAGRSLKAAIVDLRRLGAREVSADQLHLPSGALVSPAPAPPPAPGTGPFVGVIDGGVAGAALSRGFATGAPRANDHGTAVASLVTGSGPVRGALPGARIASADVFGTDPAGGNATAIARALGWLVGERVPVATISLAGPPNPLLGRVVAAAQARGLAIVAATGNNGAASAPAYPASYPGVIAVTAVDSRDRVLIEAGRALHVDYAAPGATMLAVAASGRAFAARGTSFAAPFVAGTLARFYASPDPRALPVALKRVDSTAKKLGPRYGRGLVCGECRTPAK